MTQPIRLLQIAKHFHPDTGGIETVTQSISDMLPVHGVTADVLCTAMAHDYPRVESPYRVYRCKPDLRFGRNKSVSLDYIRAVGRLSGDYDAALLHLPNPIGAAAALIGWKKPLILLWHADIPQPTIRTMMTLLDRAVIARASAVIGPTAAHIEQSHRADALRGKGVIIPLPFDAARLPRPTGGSAALAQARAFARGRRIALSVGRLVPYKGFDVLIEAARSFGDDLVSVIVGSGPMHGELARLIKDRGAEDRVLLLGQVDGTALADLLDAAATLCMPSTTAAEMYGMVQLEAFSFGKPVVSTRIPRSGVPYVNRDGETGLIVPPGDADGLAAALRRLVDDDDLRGRLGARALSAVETEHDMEAVASRYATLVRAVTGR